MGGGGVGCGRDEKKLVKDSLWQGRTRGLMTAKLKFKWFISLLALSPLSQMFSLLSHILPLTALW